MRVFFAIEPDDRRRLAIDCRRELIAPVTKKQCPKLTFTPLWRS